MSERLRRCLDEAGVSYEVLHHPPDVRARETATDTGTRPEEFAKTLLVEVDGEPAMAVLPASLSLAPSRLAASLGAEHVRLLTERDYSRLCPDSEVGAAPPFGPLYGLPVYASPALARDERITFNAGAHDTALRMRFADFARLVSPRLVAMARGEEGSAEAPR
jgi:Ala-tRNA(Pro) deacylase